MGLEREINLSSLLKRLLNQSGIIGLAPIAGKPETATNVVSGKLSVEYQKFVSVIDGYFTVITLYSYLVAVVTYDLTAYCVVRFIKQGAAATYNLGHFLVVHSHYTFASSTISSILP